MPGRVNGFSIAYTAIGGVVLWSGIKGETLSDTFRGLLSGQAPAGGQQPVDVTTADTAAAAAGSGAPAHGGTARGDTSAHSPSAAANQATARLLAVSLGHPDWIAGQQWRDWVSLWNQESGWSTTAVNKGTGATGIPQLLPSAHAIPPGWSSATVQITWGINYIAGRYPGGPSEAWAHEQANGWY